MPADWRLPLGLSLLASVLVAQHYTAPAGIRPPMRKPGPSILPGGRVIAPLGAEYPTGPGPFGLAMNASGKTIATANAGPWIYSMSVFERLRTGRFEVHHVVAGNSGATGDWKGVSTGIVFAGERGLYLSEGNSGRVSLFDSSDERRRVFDLDQGDYHDSYTGDLAFDSERGILYVVDQANFRVAAIDVKSRQTVASIPTGRLPFAVALSPNRRKLYVTNLGLLDYRAVPGASVEQAASTGLPFPAFGFPSAEASAGVERTTAHGPVRVPGVGDPNARESNSVCIVDVTTPAQPKVEAFVRTGQPLGENMEAGSGPSAVLATADRVFVSNANQDSITVIDAKSNNVAAEIPIVIPGFQKLRGVLPIGMAYHERTGWLLVAEAGINAVGVIDVNANKVLGHLPAAWYPTRVALDGDTVLVANAKGHGVGPNVAAWSASGPPPYMQLYQGTLSVFPLPAASELPAHTAAVMAANGFLPAAGAPMPIPDGIRHVVLIVKESRSFDEVLGDVEGAPGAPVMSAPGLARLGSSGYVDGRRERVSIRDADLTPNHHAIARRWSFSDNFYANSEGSVDGHHWLTGAYPNPWTETSLWAAFGGRKEFRLGGAPGRLAFPGTAASVQPEDRPAGGLIWDHLARHGVSFYNFGEGFELAGVQQGRGLEPTGARFLTNMPMPEALYRNTSRVYPGFNIHTPDQYRASQFIHEIEHKYGNTGVELPQFIYLHLPNDYLAAAQPTDGYPYEESFMMDNDYALGRVIEYLSGTPWWKNTVIFITEADAQGGVDHIDAHRTLLLCAGPWARRGYVSHVNAGFPSLLKTVFRVLRVPSLNLFDASAADLAGCLAATPDFAPYKALPVDKRVFDPASLPSDGVARSGDSPQKPPRLR